MKDWMLGVGVLGLVILDLIILAVYTGIEGTSGLSVDLILNRENPGRIESVSFM